MPLRNAYRHCGRVALTVECAPRQGLQVHYCPPVRQCKWYRRPVTSAGSVSKASHRNALGETNRDIWFDVGHQPGSLFHALVDNRAADAGDMAL